MRVRGLGCLWGPPPHNANRELQRRVRAIRRAIELDDAAPRLDSPVSLRGWRGANAATQQVGSLCARGVPAVPHTHIDAAMRDVIVARGPDRRVPPPSPVLTHNDKV